MAQAAVPFSIATGSTEPIYRQLVDQVQRLVAGGQLAPGDELPSVRAVAEALAVNPMTVSKAYGLLEAAGTVERRRGLGMVIAAQTATGARSELLKPVLDRLTEAAAQLGMTDEQVVAEVRRALRRRT